MADKKPRGTARVTFITNLDLIRRELDQGWTAQAIYDRHPELFAGTISYAHFARYAAQVRGGLPITSTRKPKPKPAQDPAKPGTAQTQAPSERLRRIVDETPDEPRIKFRISKPKKAEE